MNLADRTTRISGSPTMKVTATVDRLRRSGIEVIDFGAGEPDFPTPDAIKAAAHEALDRIALPPRGIADLKRAICDRIGRLRRQYRAAGHRHRGRQQALCLQRCRCSAR